MRILRHFSTVLITLLFPVGGSLAEPGDESWSDAYHLPGPDNYVHTLTSTPEGVYACGAFRGLGRHDARAVALVTLTGDTWNVQSFGDDLDEAWRRPVTYEGRLTVPGMKLTQQGEEVFGAYAFDGQSWSPLVGSSTYYTIALAVYGEDLYRIGSDRADPGATHQHLWRWSGEEWVAVLPVEGRPIELLVHDGKLVVSGNFTSAGGVPVSNVFAWDGTTVHPLGEGLTKPIGYLVDWRGDLVAGGTEGLNDGLISLWDGMDWSVLLEGRRVQDLSVWNDQLVAATDSISTIGWGPTERDPDILIRDTGGWSLLLSHETYWAAPVGEALLMQNRDPSGLAGGVFSPGLVAYRAGAFAAPFPAGMGFPDKGMSLTMYGDQLLAGGHFRYGAGMVMEGAATFDGSAWTARDTFDLGLPWYQEPMGFTDIVAVQDDLFGIYHIFELDISFYILLKRDPDPPHDGVWRQFPGGTYHFLGKLQAVGNRLFTWIRDEVHEIDTETGTKFATAPAELDGYIQSSCDLDSRLVIAGDFTTLNGVPSSNILRYEDTHWVEHAPALPGPVSAIAPLPDGRLAAAYQAGLAHRIAVFDGSTWVYHQGDFDGPVQALAWHQDRLVVSGYFTCVDGLDASGIAVWTGGRWARVGSGFGGWSASGLRIEDLVSTGQGLYISGNMTTAGGHRTGGLAVWTGDLRLISGLSPVAEDLPAHTDPFGLRAYPNPFNPRTAISWDLSAAGPLTVAIHDLRGRRVRTLVSGHRPAGPDKAIWDGLLDNGRPAPSGIYHLRLEWNGRAASRKLTLVR